MTSGLDRRGVACAHSRGACSFGSSPVYSALGETLGVAVPLTQSHIHTL